MYLSTSGQLHAGWCGLGKKGELSELWAQGLELFETLCLAWLASNSSCSHFYDMKLHGSD